MPPAVEKTPQEVFFTRKKIEKIKIFPKTYNHFVFSVVYKV